MRKRFNSQTPTDATEAPASGPLIAPEETTHRYFSNAIADIRSAITQARAATESPPADASAPEAPDGVPETGRRWASELPPMAATETPAMTEVTQRYADQSVAGIRAAIAAAREAEAQASSRRGAARFVLGATPEVRVPSLVIPPEPVSPADGGPAPSPSSGDDPGEAR